MLTLAQLERKIKGADDLLAVVKTMKALAAVNIRQYEQAVTALAASVRTVELGMQAVLRGASARAMAGVAEHKPRVGAIVFGSDQGMCGPLNERIVQHALAELSGENSGARDGVEAPILAAVGAQVIARLDAAGHAVQAAFPVPNSVAGITPFVHDLLATVGDWRATFGISRLVLFHAEVVGAAAYRPISASLLPLDRGFLDGLKAREWPTRQVPQFRMPRKKLFRALLERYLFIGLFRAVAQSLASENASRLAAMQVAEKHIAERLDELRVMFQQERQTAVTAELLDIVSGFKALIRE